MRIIVSTIVAAPIHDVWRAYTTPEDIKLWNAASPDWHTTAASVDLRPGGKFCSRMEAKEGSFGFDFEGKYTKVVQQQLIEYELGDRLAVVEFADGAHGVTVTVTFDSETTHSQEQQREGWQAILDNFAHYMKGKLAQPRVSEITRGKVELLSLDYLVGLCAKSGISVGLKIAA